MRAWHASSVRQDAGHLRATPFRLQATGHGPPCHVVLRRCLQPRVAGLRLLGVARGSSEDAADTSGDDSKYSLAPDSLFEVPLEAEVVNGVELSPQPTGAGDGAGAGDERVDAMPLGVQGLSSTTTATTTTTTTNSNSNTIKGSRWLEKDSILLASESEDMREKVYLVGCTLKSDSGRSGYGIEESLEELGRLADTAGLKVVGSTYQILEIPNNSTYIGSGKVVQVAVAARALNVETVIFDDELSPAQLRNLEKAINGGKDTASSEFAIKVCDRTALILDIFSQRAATREGKLQVELAQTEYQLPRLTRMWSHLDRVGGGGQVKGAGEKQIEMDKRMLRDRASQLRRELEAVRTHRRNYRERRNMMPIPVAALVGYTNAGKSTVLNTLTRADVLAEDKLFATLDPTTRKVRLKGNKEVLVSDTVGFIQKLPTELVAAFRATLEEIQDAAIIIHVVDISHPNAQAQSDAVSRVLKELQVEHIPLVTAWNKVDLCPSPDEVFAIAGRRRDPTVCISGRTGEGLDELFSLVQAKLVEAMDEVAVHLPYQQGELLEQLHRTGEVLHTEYTADGVYVQARVPPSVAGRLRPYRLEPVDPSSPHVSDDEMLRDQEDSNSANFSPGWKSDSTMKIPMDPRSLV